MLEKKRRSLRAAVLLVGLGMAFVITLLPLPFTDISQEELREELTTGAGIGFLVISSPYFLFWMLTRSNTTQKLFNLVALGLLALGLAGTSFILISSSNPINAQAAVLYVFILLAQLVAVSLLGIRGEN